MQSEWTEAEIAPALGVSERTVKNRARTEGWPTVKSPQRGGKRACYPGALLPEDVRLALARWCLKSEEATVGFAEGCAWQRQTAAAETATRTDAEARLAAYGALGPDKQRTVDAKIAILDARDAFLTASSLPLKRGSMAFCEALKAGHIPLDPEIVRAVAMRKGKISLSWASLHRWQQIRDDIGPAGLAPGYRGVSGSRIPAHMQEFVVAMMIEFPHLKTKAVREKMRGRFKGQDIPGPGQVRRYMARWREENTAAYTMLTAPDQYRNKFRPGPGQADGNIERLNQVWEFDGTPADVMCTDGRFTLIGVIDIYSRRAKLHVAPTAKAAAVAALTRRALLDWGVPETARTDNGSDYVSRHMRRVFDDLGIFQDILPPFSPEKKPFVERFFRTFSHGLLEEMIGYIGHNVSDRKAIEERQSFAKRLMTKGETVDVGLSSEALQRFCDRWCAAVYHHNAHGSLGGRTPAEMARGWTGTVNRIEDERALDILLLPAAGDDGMRYIGKKGVKVDNGEYWANEMAPHVGKSVFVLTDVTDWGQVYCFWPGSPREFFCRAVDPQRAGIDPAEFAARAKHHAKEMLDPEIKRLRGIVKKQAVKNIHEEYLQFREGEIENVVEMPRPSVPYSTPEMDEAMRAADDVLQQAMGPQPIDITEEEDAAAREVIRLAEKRQVAGLPSTDMEVFEALQTDRDGGLALTVNEENWLADYDHYLLTGQKRGLHAAGFQPFAERKATVRRRKAEGER